MYTDDQKYGLITKPEPEKISRYDLINKPEPDELYHHGVKGMRWGKRRYQNPDGTLTPEGKARLKKQWMNNPKEFAKHYDELTEAERKYAMKKRQEIQQFSNSFAKRGKVNAAAANVKDIKGMVNDIGTIAGAGLAAYTFFNSPKGKQIVAKVMKHKMSSPQVQKTTEFAVRVLRNGGKYGFVTYV